MALPSVAIISKLDFSISHCSSHCMVYFKVVLLLHMLLMHCDI